MGAPVTSRGRGFLVGSATKGDDGDCVASLVPVSWSEPPDVGRCREVITKRLLERTRPVTVEDRRFWRPFGVRGGRRRPLPRCRVQAVTGGRGRRPALCCLPGELLRERRRPAARTAGRSPPATAARGRYSRRDRRPSAAPGGARRHRPAPPRSSHANRAVFRAERAPRLLIAGGAQVAQRRPRSRRPLDCGERSEGPAEGSVFRRGGGRPVEDQ